MRRLVILLLAVIAATSGYNFVLQEIKLDGSLILTDTVTCDNINDLHVGGKSVLYDCYNSMSKDTPPKLEARKLAYTGDQITTKASNIDFVVTTIDGSKIDFTLTSVANTKVGALQSPSGNGHWTPVAVDPASTTTAAPATTTPAKTFDCDPIHGLDKDLPECLCTDIKNKGQPPCTTFCTKDTDTNVYPACKKDDASTAFVKTPAKGVKKPAPRPQPASAAGEATVLVEHLPPAIRLRGPGPVLPPIRQSPPEDAVVVDEDEERRVKRDGGVDLDVKVTVSFYILDEPGNAAAVWAAVIEGIILLLLVGACLYFFCWAPRARASASAAADPYKEEGPNYSVSYANSSFNQRNERIDAFQNPPAPTPAAPPRPANSAYLDDYITDNIGAMSRPGGTSQPPASAAAAAPAFEPRHQRFDSSGLVTVNLS